MWVSVQCAERRCQSGLFASLTAFATTYRWKGAAGQSSVVSCQLSVSVARVGRPCPLFPDRHSRAGGNPVAVSAARVRCSQTVIPAQAGIQSPCQMPQPSFRLTAESGKLTAPTMPCRDDPHLSAATSLASHCRADVYGVFGGTRGGNVALHWRFRWPSLVHCAQRIPRAPRPAPCRRHVASGRRGICGARPPGAHRFHPPALPGLPAKSTRLESRQLPALGTLHSALGTCARSGRSRIVKEPNAPSS